MNISEVAFRYLLIGSFGLFGFLCFGVRVLIHWKQTGSSGITLEPGDDAHGFINRWFKLIIAGLSALIVVEFLRPDWMARAAPPFFDPGPLRFVGLGLIWIASILCFVAQLNMRESWRVGIDTRQKTELVARGLFKVSRNPIYVTLLISLVSLFLVLPNWMTLFTFVLAYVLIQVQVRLEEAFLGTVHGASYTAYRAHVRRWF